MGLNTKQQLLLVLLVKIEVFSGNSTTISPYKTNISTKRLNVNTLNDTKSDKNNTANVITEFILISTTKEPFEMCEINSTCNATDLLLNTTEIDLVANFSEKTPVIRNDPISQQICVCDLQVGFLLFFKYVL